ncbi:MAG: carboxypeptidase regulatory-like domain-containing protein [Methanomassiliicoccales archaeon]|nr:carboxypeptidase regulatory-like domain-containing protein [Methanomassiliicoccales archaeon]
MNEVDAAEPTVVFTTDFEGIGIFISDWAPLGWSRGVYVSGHGDDQWCRANADWMRTLSNAVGYTISAHSSASALYCAKLGVNDETGYSSISSGYPDPGMDAWVRFAPPEADRYDGMTLTFWYWAKTGPSDYNGELTDLLRVNVNNGTGTRTAWTQPYADSQGWRMATVEMPAGTVWMEWEYKASETPLGHYPGALIDDVTVVTGKVLPGPPTSHVVGMSGYYNARTVSVPVSMSDADRISLHYRSGEGTWTKYVDDAHSDGLFTGSPITFKAPGDGRFDVFSIASNLTDSEPMKSVAEASFIIDTVSPTVSMTAPIDGSLIGTGSVKVNWTADDVGSSLAKTEMRIDGGGLTAVSGTSYTFGSLTEGAHTVTVVVTDLAGNSAQASVTFIVDLNAPAMTFTPTGTDVARSSKISVSFQDEVDKASIGITVEGVQGSLSWSGDAITFTPSSLLAPGSTYEVTVAGKNAGGDGFSETWSFSTVEDRGTITGIVRDGNGDPVAGATVTLSSGASTTTDDNGRFEFINVSSGNYTVSVSKDGYQTLTMEVEVTPMQFEELGTLSLGSGGGNASTTYYIVAAFGFVVLLAFCCAFYIVRRRG